MSILALFRAGFALATRHLTLVLVLLVVNVLTAALALLVPANALSDAATFTAIRDAADGVDMWQLLDILQGSSIRNQLGISGEDPAYAALGNTLLLTLGLLPLLAAIPAAFLKGGVYHTLHQSPQPVSFVRAGWRWFGSFLLLAVINLFVAIVVISVAIALFSALAGTPFFGAGLVGIGLILLFWWQISELTGAFLIAHNRKNTFWGWFEALGFVAGNFGRITLFYLLTLTLILAVHTLFRFVIHPLVPLTWWAVVLLVNQTFIALRLWLKVARLGSITQLVQTYTKARVERAEAKAAVI